MNPLQKYISQPYPFYFEGKKLFEIGLVIVLLAFVLNYFVRPYNLNFSEHKMAYFWIALIHSTSILIPLFVIAFLAKYFTQYIDNWTVKKELFLLIGLLILLGIINFLLRDVIYKNPLNWSWKYLFEEVINTTLLGSFLAALIISINLNIQFIKNNEKASAINNSLRNKERSPEEFKVFIKTEVKSDSFALDLQKFIFAKSEGNYIKLWIIKDTQCSIKIKRIALKEFESILTDFKQIIKVHRSYVLNIDFIDQVVGNAQGYKIKLKNCAELVPVSRNHIQTFNKTIEALIK